MGRLVIVIIMLIELAAGFFMAHRKLKKDPEYQKMKQKEKENLK